MKRSIAGFVVAGALLVPAQLAPAVATAAPAPVADSGSSSTGSGGCTSSQPPTCSSPLAYLLLQLVNAIATGSANAR
ncbi:hypothetical protein [Nocardia gipuzkoensis]|uniref:hypothetical protein n=1 Tax=Nocardia gipuzkoensis TaxID=2749991 RepID=UPI0015EEA03D|nr:hypothetical protein [Nocardia gipuzkoensis]